MDILRKDTALQYKRIRRLLKSPIPSENEPEPPGIGLGLKLIIYIMLFLGMLWLMLGHANAAEGHIPQAKAIQAIIGEAENQGYTGMLAVAGAIRNRGTLKGVYGLHAYRVTHHKYTAHTYNQALRAWMESGTHDITHGATGWGSNADLKVFEQQAWFARTYFTAHIGDHWFYAMKG